MNKVEALRNELDDVTIKMRRARRRFFDSLTMKQYDKAQTMTIGNEYWYTIDIDKITKDTGKQRCWYNYIELRKEYKILNKRDNFYIVEAA